MYDIVYENIQEKEEFNKIILKVLDICFEKESLKVRNWYINVILTTPENIQEINNDFRGINKQTDVLSFPMFEKEDLEKIIKNNKKQNHIPNEINNNDEINNNSENILGDIVISIQRVEEQSKEYNHSFERELSYMVVHGFYHLMGYDHMEENDKKQMREKEELVLKKLEISR